MTINIETLLKDKLSEKKNLSKQTEEKMLNVTNSLTIDSFFDSKLSELDDIELDMIFSYLFTPDMETRIFFGNYPQIILSESEVYQLAHKLESLRIDKIVIDNEGKEHKLPLKEVNILRYLRLLHLTKEIPAALLASIEKNAAKYKGVLVALIRDMNIPVTENRIQVIDTLLHGLAKNNMINTDTCTYIINFIQENNIKNLPEFEAKLLMLNELYRKESGKKVYYSDELGDVYGGGNVTEISHDKMRDNREKQKKLTEQIKDILGYLHDEAPAAFK